MTQQDVCRLLSHLKERVEQGFTLLTWNGLGFDFDVLSEESDNPAMCQELALDHVDMMFHVFCERGFPVSNSRTGSQSESPFRGVEHSPVLNSSEET